MKCVSANSVRNWWTRREKRHHVRSCRHRLHDLSFASVLCDRRRVFFLCRANNATTPDMLDDVISFQIPEVLQWLKCQSEDLFPHLMRFTEHFNKMSFWVRTAILTLGKMQNWKRILSKLIRIMRVRQKRSSGRNWPLNPEGAMIQFDCNCKLYNVIFIRLTRKTQPIFSRLINRLSRRCPIDRILGKRVIW